MALPHYKNFKAARENDELVSASLFQGTIIPPDTIREGFDIVNEHIQVISGAWDDKNSSEVIQMKIGHVSTNHASDNPGDNTINFTIQFSNFLDKEYKMYVYNKIRDWRRLVFDAATGIQGEKRTYVGTFIVEKLSRIREVVGRRKLLYVFPINDMPLWSDLDHESAEGSTITVEFVADDHEDLYR